MSTYSYRLDNINYLAVFLLLNVFNYSLFRYQMNGFPLNETITTISEYLRPLISLFFLFFIWKTKIVESKYKWFLYFLILYFFGGIISFVVKGDFEALLYSLWALASSVSVLTSTDDQIKEAIRLSLYFVFGCLFLGLLNGVFPFNIAFSSKTYWPSLLVVMLIILNYTQPEKRKILLHALVFTIFFVALSGKRAALFLALMFLWFFYKKVFVYVFLFVLLLIYVQGTDVITSFYTVERFQLLNIDSGNIIENNSSSSWSDRRWITESYFDIWNNNKMGIGIGQSSKFHAMTFPENRLAGYSPHNSFLAAFVEAGLLGGFAYLMLTVRVLVKNRYDIGKFLIILIVCFQMYIEYNSSPGQVLFLPYLIFLRTLW